MARLFTAASHHKVQAAASPTPVVTGGTSITMACWFKASSLPSVNCVFYSFSNVIIPASYILLLMDSAGKVYSNYNDGTNNRSVATTVAASTGVWHHVCGVFTSTGMSIYLDGANKQSLSAALKNILTTRTTAGALTLNSGDGNWYDGVLAECITWNFALNDAQVAALATGWNPAQVGLNTFGVFNSTYHYWPLYGAASPEPNLSSNGSSLNGTVTGAVIANHAPVGIYYPKNNPRTWVTTATTPGIFPMRTLRGVGI